jgi:uncharacterized protein YkwD
MIPVALAVLLSAVSPAEIEASAARQIVLSYERAGRRTPIRDEALSTAARALARATLGSSARAVAELVPLTEAISSAGGWDPSPRAFVVKTSPADEILLRVRERTDFATEAASHLGIGAAVEANASAVVILLAERRATLDRGPVSSPRGSSRAPMSLCGALEPPLVDPQVLITVPGGSVERAGLSNVDGGRFCARILLPSEGRYTVELLGRGPRGPEVAALFFLDVGAETRAEGSVAPEPGDVAAARAEILERVNALRKAVGSPPVRIDPGLSAVAQAYSERMAREGFFSHVAPDGSTLFKRLRGAGYVYRGAGENLGRADGPLAAHFGVEHSPGHRLNVVDPRWSLLGIGIAEATVDGRRDVFLAEIFVEPVKASRDPLAEAYAAVAKRRAELNLPALRRSAALELLAIEHARRALARDEPKVEVVDPELHDRVFTALAEAGSAAVDFFIGDSPVPPTDTRALADARNAYVGIGAVKGDSAKFGRGHYWVVVIYAAPP